MVSIIEDDDDWKGQYKGREFEELKVAEKIAWLNLEQERIRDLQEDEQLRCGQAYIAKEEAYKAYERRGGYGGPDWKRYVANAINAKSGEVSLEVVILTNDVIDMRTPTSFAERCIGLMKRN